MRSPACYRVFAAALALVVLPIPAPAETIDPPTRELLAKRLNLIGRWLLGPALPAALAIDADDASLGARTELYEKLVYGGDPAALAALRQTYPTLVSRIVTHLSRDIFGPNVPKE